MSLNAEQWATPSPGHLPWAWHAPPRGVLPGVPHQPPPLGAMSGTSPRQLSALPGRRETAWGWVRRVLLWHPKTPQMQAGSRQGTACCPPGPRKGLIYCCVLKDAIKAAARVESTAAGADQCLINVGQLVILSDNYPQTV